MKAAIFLNAEGNKPDIVEKLCNKLVSIDILPMFSESQAEESGGKYPIKPFAQLLSECDIVLALGGDGTIIHAAKHAALYGKQVLGINGGHLGFTAGLEANELDLLDALQTKEYTIDSRMLLEVTVSGRKNDKYYCLNDAVISRGALSRIVEVEIKVNDDPCMNYRADGVIVATPTGSTAYSLSAGAPMIDPSINGILVTPICAHSFSTVPIFIDAASRVCVNATARAGSEIYLTIDGERSIKLRPDDVVTSRRAQCTANLIKIKSDNFVQILNKKMIGRCDYHEASQT